MKNKIIVGSRGSALARWQTNWVMTQLESSGWEIEKVLIQTTGDKNLTNPLYQIGDKGLFTKELDGALLDGTIDVAVHSLKDLPTELPKGLLLVAITKREDPRDGLISRGASLAELPKNSAIATGSLRRRAQLLAFRKDFKIENIRGNVDTRLKKFDGSSWQGLILAGAGLKRLGLDGRITEFIDPSIMLPAVGQGSLGVVCRAGDDSVMGMLKGLEHSPSSLAIRAERNFLKILEGGCQVPLGALGQIKGQELLLEGFVGDLQGVQWVRDSCQGPSSEPEKIGEELAQKILNQGGKAILENVRQETEQ